MELTDLNLAIAHYGHAGDLRGMENCLQHSLQPTVLLKAIYTSKQYQILPRVFPLLRIAGEISVPFDKVEFDQLLLAVCLDLYKRGDQTGFETCLSAGKFQVNDFLHFILNQKEEALRCFSTLINQYKIGLFDVIVERDDVFFFHLYFETIDLESPSYSECATLARAGAINILSSMNVAEVEEASDCCIRFILPSVSPYRERREKQLRLVIYLKSTFGFSSNVEDFFYVLFKRKRKLQTYFLLQAGFKPSEEMMQKLKAKNQAFYSEIFEEDV